MDNIVLTLRTSNIVLIRPNSPEYERAEKLYKAQVKDKREREEAAAERARQRQLDEEQAARDATQDGIAESDEQVVIRQGVEIRRPSEMYVRATRDGQRVTNVRVGGYAVEVLRGTARLG
jgi:hypothetical protein